MLARLGPGNILHQHAIHVLLNLDKQNVNKSWFSGIRTISTQYGLTDPLLVLQSPPSYSHWKNLTKCKVLEWWLQRYRAIAHHMNSLQYFNPSFMSLSRPHPIWTSAGSPFEVRKAVVSARMLSGRYRTDILISHWNNSNPLGLCRLPGCEGETGTLTHILLHCPALGEARARALSHWKAFLVPR